MSEAMAIVCENLSRHFGPVRAVDGISFQVPAATIFGFLGPNGAGKTTTIRLLLGLLEPTGGRATVLGWDIVAQAERIREQAGLLPQNMGLYQRLSGYESLELFGRIYRLPRQERQARIRQLLMRLGLWERRDEPISRWSGGMQRKLALARALLHRPRLLILDEPTAGLDAVSAVALRQELAAMARNEGVTVFLSTHNLHEAQELCQEVAVIKAGKIIAQGSPAQLRELGRRRELLLRGRGFTEELLQALAGRQEVVAIRREGDAVALELQEGADTAALIAFAVARGAAIEEAQRPQASLEEVFIELLQGETNAH